MSLPRISSLRSPLLCAPRLTPLHPPSHSHRSAPLAPRLALRTLSTTAHSMSDRSLRILTSADVDAVLDSLDQKLAVDSQRAVFAAYSTAGEAEDSECRLVADTSSSLVLFCVPARNFA